MQKLFSYEANPTCETSYDPTQELETKIAFKEALLKLPIREALVVAVYYGLNDYGMEMKSGEGSKALNIKKHRFNQLRVSGTYNIQKLLFR